MKLRNTTDSFKYSKLANKRLEPGCATRDLSDIRDFVSNLLDRCRGLRMELSDQDMDALKRLVEHGSRQVEEISMLSVPKEPPMTLDESRRQARIEKQTMQREAMRIIREREERVKAESNMLDESGNPINDKLLSQATIKDIKPELHPEMGNEIDKIMANNMAVLEARDQKPKVPSTLTLGVEDFAKDKNAIIAKKDGTKVPTDPAYYQNAARAVPQGVPDVPGAAEQYRDASKWKHAPGMPSA